MNAQQSNHLRAQRRMHKERLRVLELKQAQYGINCPPEVQIEINEIGEKIASIDAVLSEYNSPRSNGYSNQNTASSSSQRVVHTQQVAVPKEVFFVIGGILVVAFIALLIYLNTPSTKISDSFGVDQGLGAWRSRGNATLITEGRESDPAFHNTTTSTTARSSSTQVVSGTVQIQTPANSFIYQRVPDVAKKGEFYSAQVWCKAPLGVTCRMFLGPIQEGLNPPVADSDKTISRTGTGKWESMIVRVMADKDEPFGIFLYVEGEGESLLYDDLLVLHH